MYKDIDVIIVHLYIFFIINAFYTYLGYLLETVVKTYLLETEVKTYLLETEGHG